MNKHLSFFFLAFISLFSFNNLLGQTWFPQGAKWYYSTELCNNPFFPQCGYYTMEVMGDTVLSGQNAKVLKIEEFGMGSSFYNATQLEFLYEDNDRIYRYFNGKYHVLYDFNLAVGDTLFIQDSTEFRGYTDHVHHNVDTLIFYAVVVDSIDTISLNGHPVRVQYNHALPVPGSGNDMAGYSWNMGGIYEFMGGYEHFTGMPEIRLVSNILSYGHIRCYEGDSISYHHPDYLQSCDGFSSSRAKELASSLEVFPNPTQGRMTVKTGSPFGIEKEVRLRNLLGETLAIHRSIEAEISFHPHGLSPGMYLLDLKIEGQPLRTAKVLIE